jgi:putative ABC transport system ATP-binding protein
LIAPDGGQIMLDGEDPIAMDDNGCARMRRDTVGVVFSPTVQPDP